MAVPSVITDLNVSAASNSPAGTDPIGNTLDDFLRGIQAIVRREQAQGAAIASASTTNIASNTDGNYVHITGTTTITSFGTVAAGISRTVVFDGVLTLTHNASSLVLPGGANIITAPNDIAEFVSEGSGNWRCVKYIPAAQYYLSKSVAGGSDVTLTSAEAGAWVINLTGVLTANINLIFPTTLKQWLVVNNTTGSFTVTCKTASGTGSTVPQGGLQSYYGDGTNLGQGPGDSRYQLTSASTSSVQGAFKNLVISCTGASAAVSITADEIVVENTSNTYVTLRNVAVSPSLSASGANGLDSGTSAANSWYAEWVIYGAVAGTAGLLSLSATSPTMPSGYTHKARVGWCRTDSTGNKYPLGMIQRGRIAEYVVGTAGTNLTAYPQASSGIQGSPTSGTYVALPLTNYVPTSTAAAVFVLARVNNGSVLVSPNNNSGAVDSSNPPIFCAYSSSSAITFPQQGKVLLQSSSVYHAMSTATCALFISGWEDNL